MMTHRFNKKDLKSLTEKLRFFTHLREERSELFAKCWRRCRRAGVCRCWRGADLYSHTGVSFEIILQHEIRRHHALK